MKRHKFPSYSRLVLPVLILLALLATPFPALAALGITGVQPNVVSSASSVDLVITGTDFADGAVVILDTFGALATSFVSSTVLTAVLPAGITPGVYSITVVNPDSSSVTLTNALTVRAPSPTSTTPSDAPTPTPFLRPLIVVDGYSAGVKEVYAGQEIHLVVKLKNAGGGYATNVVVTFTAGDFVPRGTGGVVAISQIAPGNKTRIEQPMTAAYEIIGKTFATVNIEVTYTDLAGVTYSVTFSLSVPVVQARPGAYSTATSTPTATVVPNLRPQLVITGYSCDISILQPGTHFTLNLQVSNVGSGNAKRVTMILGGGSSSGGSPAGTPDVGGVSGGTGDFTNFAPVASSNVQFLGDLPMGNSFNANASLIVNATTNPGAYPMKISFTYLGENNSTYTDDQVITLLVYSLPQVEVNFYRDPGPLYAGQSNQLPLQVVNLGRKTSVLGSMRVSTSNAQLSNNVTLVGALDPGGYFTLDAMAIPDQPGPLELLVTIDYTDDFNQPQVITKTVSVEVMETPVIEPGTNGSPDGGVQPTPLPQPETFWQKVLRFLRGLFGLDSAAPTPPPTEIVPSEVPPGGVPVPVPKPGPKG